MHRWLTVESTLAIRTILFALAIVFALGAGGLIGTSSADFATVGSSHDAVDRTDAVETERAVENRTENVTLYAAGSAEFEKESELERWLETTTVNPTEDVLVDDTLIVAIESSRLASDLEERRGTATDRFLSVLDDEANLSIVQTNPRAQVPTKTMRVGSDDTTVNRNASTTYVAIDIGEVEIGYEPSQDEEVPDELRDGERFAVAFGYGDVRADDEDPEVEFHEARAELVGDWEYLAPTIVNGTASVADRPGVQTEIRVEFEDGTVLSDRVEAVAWADLSGFTLALHDVEAGTNYTLELRYGGEAIDRVNGTVLEPEARLSDPSVERHPRDDEHVVVNVTAELSHGGAVAAATEEGDRIRSTGVPANETAEASIVIHEDVFEDLESPVLRLLATGRVGENVDLYDATPIAIDISEHLNVSTPTETSTETATPSPTPEAGNPVQRFGVGVAILSLFLLGYLVRRRF